MAGAGVIGDAAARSTSSSRAFSLPVGAVPPDVMGRRIAGFFNSPIAPLIKLYLLVLISLPLYHWAHRFRYFLFDLGLHGGRMALAYLCYGAAVVGTIAAALVLIRV